METVATFDTIIDANIAMGRLKAEEIECWLADEHLVQTDMLYSPAIGGIRWSKLSIWPICGTAPAQIQHSNERLMPL